MSGLATLTKKTLLIFFSMYVEHFFYSEKKTTFLPGKAGLKNFKSIDK
jgi:hypothetical protein